jgi:hypothetical protein
MTKQEEKLRTRVRDAKNVPDFRPKRKKTIHNPMFYYLNRVMSYSPLIYWFYIVIGSRGRGKTVSAWRWVLKRFLKYGELFVWLRLTDAPLKKMARNSSKTIVPKFLLEQLGIDSVFIKGSTVFINILKDGRTDTKMVGILDSISTFYTTKGNTMEEFTNVVFDEINREATERNTFDVTRAFINQIETIARLRKMRVLMLGNTISDTSDILAMFNFIPKEFGIYKLTRRHAIIEYLEDSEEFKLQRKNSLAGALLGSDEATSQSFTNIALQGLDRTEKYANHRQMFIFHVDSTKAYGIYERKNEEGWFVGKVRGTTNQKYKISPFINCEGIYDMEIYKSFLELVGVNKVWYETAIIRQRFIVALKKNRTVI